MTAPADHPFESTTHDPGQGNPGSPPLTDSTATNIHTDASVWDSGGTTPETSAPVSPSPYE
jgi:hypothetical protein